MCHLYREEETLQAEEGGANLRGTQQRRGLFRELCLVWYGCSVRLKSGETGRGYVTEHAECHAKAFKLYLWTTGTGMGGPETWEYLTLMYILESLWQQRESSTERVRNEAGRPAVVQRTKD